MIRARPLRRWVAPAVLAAVIAVAAIPFLRGRYPFLLDFVVGPHWDPVGPLLYGFRAPAYGGKLPLLGVLSLVPPSLAAKALVPGVLVLAAVAGYFALPGPRPARLYGALVLVVNPFTYARMVAGQWAVVWGLAMLPVALWAVAAYLDDPRPRRLAAAVGAITLLAVSAHLLFASIVLLGALTLVRFAADGDLRVLLRAGTVVLVALPVNAFWLVPAVLAADGPLGPTPTGALDAFAPAADGGTALFQTASMHGFWRRATVYGRDLVPAVEAVFALLLFLAVYGALTSYDGDRGHVVTALVVTAGVALLLGAGVRGPAEPLFRWLAEAVPFFAGMRDSNKFVALLVVAYAYLGALGVAELLAVASGIPTDRAGLRRALRWAVIGLVVLAPLVYTFPMLTGYAGQVSVGDYPDEWYAAEETIAGDDGDRHAVLAVPWHRYQDLSWLDGPHRRAATPARDFFTGPVIQGDTLELGPVYSTSTNPVSRAVESTFGLGPTRDRTPLENAGERLAALDVEYVLLATEADWRTYESQLAGHPQLTLVESSEHLRLYRNDHPLAGAYATETLDESGGWTARASLSVARRSPASLHVQGSGLAYTEVAQPQLAAGPGWRYDGDPSVARVDGGRAAFRSDPTGGELRYAPFYRVNLPSYVLSTLAAVALAGYAGVAGTDRTIRRRAGPLAVRDPHHDD